MKQPNNRMATPQTRKPGRPSYTSSPEWKPPGEIAWGAPCDCGKPFASLKVGNTRKRGTSEANTIRYLTCPACGLRHTLSANTPRNPAITHCRK